MELLKINSPLLYKEPFEEFTERLLENKSHYPSYFILDLFHVLNYKNLHLVKKISNSLEEKYYSLLREVLEFSYKNHEINLTANKLEFILKQNSLVNSMYEFLEEQEELPPLLFFLNYEELNKFEILKLILKFSHLFLENNEGYKINEKPLELKEFYRSKKSNFVNPLFVTKILKKHIRLEKEVFSENDENKVIIYVEDISSSMSKEKNLLYSAAFKNILLKTSHKVIYFTLLGNSLKKYVLNSFEDKLTKFFKDPLELSDRVNSYKDFFKEFSKNDTVHLFSDNEDNLGLINLKFDFKLIYLKNGDEFNKTNEIIIKNNNATMIELDAYN
jgi:hypothetical protein